MAKRKKKVPGVDIDCQGDLSEGVPPAVTAGGLVDVVVAHFAAVHSSLDAASFDFLKLADCRHSPHRDQPGIVLEAISRFIDELQA